MGVHGARLVGLRPADDDAVRPLLHDPEVGVGVCLGMRRERPVPFRVSHCAVAGEVLLLDVPQVAQETAVVLGPAAGVDVRGGDRQGVQGVHPDAALEAAAGEGAEEPPHLALLDQVVGALVDVGEAVDLPAGEVGGCRHELCVFRAMGEIVGQGDRVHRRPDQRVVHNVCDPLPEEVGFQFELSQALLVLASRHHDVCLPHAVICERSNDFSRGRRQYKPDCTDFARIS